MNTDQAINQVLSRKQEEIKVNCYSNKPSDWVLFTSEELLAGASTHLGNPQPLTIKEFDKLIAKLQGTLINQNVHYLYDKELEVFLLNKEQYLNN